VATLINGGITAISPDGSEIEFHATDDVITTNICFGGDDLRTAYVTCSSSGRLVSFPWPRPGLRLAHQLAGELQSLESTAAGPCESDGGQRMPAVRQPGRKHQHSGRSPCVPIEVEPERRIGQARERLFGARPVHDEDGSVGAGKAGLRWCAFASADRDIEFWR
jgi:hypothetical protein